MNNVTEKKKSKALIIVIALVALAAIITVSAILALSFDSRKVNKKLKMAEKYFAELDYDNAILIYNAALDIDDQCVKAYLGLADVYMKLGNFAKANDILYTALKKLDNEEDKEIIKRKMQEVDSHIPDEDTDTPPENAGEGLEDNGSSEPDKDV